MVSCIGLVGEPYLILRWNALDTDHLGNKRSQVVSEPQRLSVRYNHGMPQE